MKRVLSGRVERTRQESLKDLSQSVCQMWMRSPRAEGIQHSYFNVIQFALTAAVTKWVIISHCHFFTKACVNCFPAVWSRRYINSTPWRHLRIPDTKRMCQRRGVNSSKHIIWRVRRAAQCTQCVLKVMAQTVCLSSLCPVLFYDVQDIISDHELGCERESGLTACLMIVLLWTTAQAAFSLPARSQKSFRTAAFSKNRAWSNFVRINLPLSNATTPPC